MQRNSAMLWRPSCSITLDRFDWKPCAWERLCSGREEAAKCLVQWVKCLERMLGHSWMWLIATSFVEGKFQGGGPAWPGQSQREWEASRNLRLHQVTSPGSEILRLESNFSPLHLYFLWGLMRRRYCLWFSLNCWWKSCHWVVCNWCWKFIVGRYPLFLSYSISLALFNIMLVLGHLYLLSELNQHNSF
jgi:hypothetical protein